MSKPFSEPTQPKTSALDKFPRLPDPVKVMETIEELGGLEAEPTTDTVARDRRAAMGWLVLNPSPLSNPSTTDHPDSAKKWIDLDNSEEDRNDLNIPITNYGHYK